MHITFVFFKVMSLPFHIMDQRIGTNPDYPHTPVWLFLQPKWGRSAAQYSTAGCWWRWACGAFEVREFLLQYASSFEIIEVKNESDNCVMGMEKGN